MDTDDFPDDGEDELFLAVVEEVPNVVHREKPTGTGYKIIQSTRNFPGPAGILPTLRSSDLTNLGPPSSSGSIRVSKIVAEDSQNLGYLSSAPDNPELNLLTKKPWITMIDAMGLATIPYINISWVKNVLRKVDREWTVPILFAVVKEIGHRATTKLIDKTGSVVVNFDEGAISLVRKNLKPGTALAIKNANLLRYGRTEILVVTKSNLVCICYTKQNSGEQVMQHFSTIDNEEIWKQYDRVNSSIATEQTK